MKLIDFSVRQPVLVNMIFLLVVIYGVHSYIALPKALDPDVSFRTVMVTAVYPGATPSEVEQFVTKPLEEELDDLEDVEQLISISRDSICSIYIEFESDVKDLEEARRDVQSRVDRATDLPEEVENPEVLKLDTQWVPIITLILSGDVSERVLKKTTEDLVDAVEALDGIFDTDVVGLREREVWVEVDPRRSERHGISLREVVGALANRNQDIPAGTIYSPQQEVLVRALGQIHEPGELGDVVIRATPDGRRIRVRDVAQISDTFEEHQRYQRLDDRPAMAVFVKKTLKGNAVRIIDRIHRLMAEEFTLPEGVTVQSYNDSSVEIRKSVKELQLNMLFGGVCVLLALIVFLSRRNAVLAFIGIPFAFLAAFILMNQFERTINGVSLFALVLVIGIVVDDAIIVLENCYRYLEQGMPPPEAALRGAKEVVAPVFASVTTTMAAFLPLFLMTGITGDFMKEIPMVVTFVLAASLFEVFFILPSHVADFARVSSKKTKELLIQRLRRRYTVLLEGALNRPLVTVGITVVLFLISLGGIGLIGVELFPDDAFPQFSVLITMPEGTRLDVTDRVVRRIEQLTREIPENEVDAVITSVGYLEKEYQPTFGPHVAMVTLDLADEDEDRRSVEEILADFRRKVEQAGIEGPRQIGYKLLETGPPAGSPVEIKLRGDSFEVLQVLAADVRRRLGAIQGVFGIEDDLTPGKLEIRLHLDEERLKLAGLAAVDVALEVRGAYEGLEATVLRQLDEEIDVIVRYPQTGRYEPEELGALRIVTPGGGSVALRDVARIDRDRGYSTINRVDFKRTVTVTAEVDTAQANVADVNRRMEKECQVLLRAFPGYTVQFGGVYADIQESFASLGQAFLVAMLLIYTILGSQFRSFLQPFVVMGAIPFAAIGVIFGLLVSGYAFSVPAMVGIVALAGIVVNDSLVLIDFANRLRRDEGLPLRQALVAAGRLRLRPIILTTVTTIFGLLPMAIGLGGASPVWKPLASAIIWGLTTSTLLTLIVIPCLYSLVERGKARVLGREVDGPGQME